MIVFIHVESVAQQQRVMEPVWRFFARGMMLTRRYGIPNENQEIVFITAILLKFIESITFEQRN